MTNGRAGRNADEVAHLNAAGEINTFPKDSTVTDK